MSRHSILDEIPEILRDKVRRALRNIPTLSDERHEQFEAATAPDEETLNELRRISARKGIDADAVIAQLSQDYQAIDD